MIATCRRIVDSPAFHDGSLPIITVTVDGLVNTSCGIVGLSDRGRYRVDLEAGGWELFNDFHLVLKGYSSYDFRPPTERASRADEQVSLALGYTF